MSDEKAPVSDSPPRLCAQCGQAVAAGARFCGHCGGTMEPPAQPRTAMVTTAVPVQEARAPGREVFCRACGRAINAAAPFCPGCGAPQSARMETGEKSRIAAALLAIFLGGFGVHKFYLARPFQGIIYILFCWTFIPAIVGFIEGIAYLCMSDAGFARKYG